MVWFLQNTKSINIIKKGFVDVNGVCPGCGTKVKFLPIDDCYDVIYQKPNNWQVIFGQRICPDSNCRAHIFFDLETNIYNNSYINIYPTTVNLNNITIEKLPVEIQNSFKEALICYENGCYIASAILIRKTLESICNLNRSSGKNLHERIQNLKNKITISEPLYDAMFELKYLGNDAAHIESQHFEKINKEELEIGLTILIEILRALYEHKDLLESFKKLKTTS